MAYNRGYGEGDALGGTRASRPSSDGTSLIARDSFFNGVYRSPRDVRIEGEFEGQIHCEGTVIVAERARVSGTINAGSVLISGAVDGEVNCTDRFEILASGQVTARVLAGSIVVREGAYYEGDMRMHQEPEGLPQREVTGTTASIDSISGRSTRRQRPAETGDVSDGSEPLAVATTARDSSETSALRAVSEG